MTPEGKVKYKINEVLKAYGKDLYKFMPVPGGFGPSSLDYILCYRGLFIAIEAKKLGGKTTARQNFIIRQIKDAGGKVFVISNDIDITMLVEFLNWLSEKPRTPQEVQQWP